MNRLTKVLVDLPNHWAEHRSESLWARKVGDDLYELQSVPFFAYDLNYRDVVRALSDRARVAEPVVREVVRRAGHTTLRVVFRGARGEGESRERRTAVLTELHPLDVSFESWGDSFFALDVAPGGDVEAVVDRLEALERRGVLGFETCEARIRGSFDGEVLDTEQTLARQ